MATVAEMRLLNDSVSDLAHTLASTAAERRRQALDEKMAEFRKRGLDIEEQRANNASDYQERMLQKQDALNDYHKGILERGQVQDVIKQLNGAHDSLQSEVDAGRMTSEEASKRASNALNAIQATGKLGWDFSKFGVLGTDFKASEQKTPHPYYDEEGNPIGDYYGNTYLKRDRPRPAGRMKMTPAQFGEGPQFSIETDLTKEDLDKAMARHFGIASGGGKTGPGLGPEPSAGAAPATTAPPATDLDGTPFSPLRKAMLPSWLPEWLKGGNATPQTPGVVPPQVQPVRPGTNEPPDEPQTAAPAPPPAQRIAGRVYSTPKGMLRWTGADWVAP